MKQNEAIRLAVEIMDNIRQATTCAEEAARLQNAIEALRPLLDQTSAGVGDELPQVIYLIENPELDEGDDHRIIWTTDPDVYPEHTPVKYTRALTQADRPADMPDIKGVHGAAAAGAKALGDVMPALRMFSSGDRTADKCATCGSVGNPSCATIGCPDFPEPADKDDRQKALKYILAWKAGSREHSLGTFMGLHGKTVIRALSGSDGRE